MTHLRSAAASLVLLALCVRPSHAQEAPESRLSDDHSPKGALWRAAAVPGWGQLYNRQYYKIPIVYAGLAGLTVSALLVNERYLLNRHAFHYLTKVDVPASYYEDYRRLLTDMGISEEQARSLESRLIDQFEQNRNILRRNRDLLYIGVGLFYGLTVLDAYVNAHLLDFDVGEDLALSVHPIPGGMSARLRLGR